LVLILAAGASAADPAEEDAAHVVMSWGGTVTRNEAADAKPVIAVDLGASQVVTDEGLKELRHFGSLQERHCPKLT
jgi:hypothetical protein